MGPTQRSSRRGAADNRANPLNTPLEYTLGAARSTISVSVARTVLDRHAATALVALRYEWRGYSVPDSSESSPSEYMLVAVDAGATIGTLTLRLDGPEGLQADDSYGACIDAVRAPGNRVCELGRLAVASHVRSKAVLTAMFAKVHAIVQELGQVTDVFIEVNPRHAYFYCKVFGFTVAGSGRMCARVRAPSVLLRLEVAKLENRLLGRDDAATAWFAQPVNPGGGRSSLYNA